MKLLIHLVNIFLWTMVLPLFTFLFSIVFRFEYFPTIQHDSFIFCNVLFSLVMILGYLVFSSENEFDGNPLVFIKHKRKS